MTGPQCESELHSVEGRLHSVELVRGVRPEPIAAMGSKRPRFVVVVCVFPQNKRVCEHQAMIIRASSMHAYVEQIDHIDDAHMCEAVRCGARLSNTQTHLLASTKL
jgi:mevalonate pyrophosphate decarboxylase